MKYPDQIVDKIVVIEPPEGGWKSEDLQLFISKPYSRSIIDLEGDSSSDIIWTAVQRKDRDEDIQLS